MLLIISTNLEFTASHSDLQPVQETKFASEAQYALLSASNTHHLEMYLAELEERTFEKGKISCETQVQFCRCLSCSALTMQLHVG